MNKANQQVKAVRCIVEDAGLDSATFGKTLGEVRLSREEARHFCASGPHNARVSLTDAQMETCGLSDRYDNYISIYEA